MVRQYMMICGSSACAERAWEKCAVNRLGNTGAFLTAFSLSTRARLGAVLTNFPKQSGIVDCDSLRVPLDAAATTWLFSTGSSHARTVTQS